MAKRACTAKNKAGEPCRSVSVGHDGLCAYHGGRIPQLTAEHARAGAKAKAERARQRAIPLTQRLHERLEAHAAEVVAAYVAGLKSDDERVRVQAAEAWMSRVYGRPTERVEQADVTELSRLTNLTEAELRKLRAELEADNVVPLPRTGEQAGQ